MGISTMSGVQPFYFGTATKRLFGCYHGHQAGLARKCGVVLCHPLGREYIRSHRTYRQLAIRLARVGFDVLRFDFYGCGDSGGDSEQGDIRQWLNDISIAVGEIRKRSGLARVCLVGLRFGGTLAMLAGVERGDIESMVLWNPIVSGRAYTEELTTLHQQLLSSARVKLEHDVHDWYTEILGFPFTNTMLADLNNLDLLAVQQKPANNILVIESAEKASDGRLKEYLSSTVPHVDCQYIPGPEIWRDAAKALVPGQIIQAVVSWISEVS